MQEREFHQRTADLSDMLHRRLAAGDGTCWLLIDPSPRALQAGETLADALREHGGALHIHSPHHQLDSRLMPLIVPAHSGQPRGSFLLQASVAEALQETRRDALAANGGRRVCGWLLTAATIDDEAATRALKLHLSRTLVQRRPSGESALLRWVDPAVLWALWQLLQPEQQAALLGPIRSFHLLDPAGRLVELKKPTPVGAVPGNPRFTPAQWADMDSLAALNQALREWGADEAAPQVLVQAHRIAVHALRRAREHGLTDMQDQAAFALRALNVHPEFDTHPLVQHKLRVRQPGDHFTALAEELAPGQWAGIGDELRQAAHTSRPGDAA